MKFRRRGATPLLIGGATFAVDLPGRWVEIPVATFAAAAGDPDDTSVVRWAADMAARTAGPYVHDETVDTVITTLTDTALQMIEGPAVWAAAWLPRPKEGVAAVAYAVPVDVTGGIPTMAGLAAAAQRQVPPGSIGERTVDLVRLPAGEAVRIAGAVRAIDGEGREIVVCSVDHVVRPDAAPVLLRLSVSWASPADDPGHGAEGAAEAEALADRIAVGMPPATRRSHRAGS